MRSEVWRYEGKGTIISITHDPNAPKKKYLYGVKIESKKNGGVYLTDEEFVILLRARARCDELRYPQEKGYAGCKMTAELYRLVGDSMEMFPELVDEQNRASGFIKQAEEDALRKRNDSSQS